MLRHYSKKYNQDLNYITTYTHIKHHQISVNGKLVFSGEGSQNTLEFLSSAYKALGLSYPKFHKMDAQCKLGLVATEYLLKESDFLQRVSLDKTAVVLSNSASSLETDRQHQHSISDKSNYFPSPAVFVYTLPNIVIGEIAIKYKITGENAFFVSEKLDAELLENYINSLFENGSEACIGGWIEVDGSNYEAFIFLAENQENPNKNSIFKPLNQATITELYNQTTWTL